MSATRLIVGSETQWYDAQTSATGIPRVMREAHAGLDAALRPMGVDLVPVHTRPSSGERSRSVDTSLADDPVLARARHEVEDLDALLILGLTMNTDFGRVLRARRVGRLPTVGMVYDLIAIQRPGWFVPRAREHYRAYLQQILLVSDHVVVTCEQVRKDLVGLDWHIPGDIHVLPLGSSFARLPPTSAKPSPLGLLYVSTVAPRKGHLLLLDAFDAIRSQGVPVELTIVGRQGWMADDIADRITTHPEYGSSLHWRRSATDTDIVEIARNCHVGVVPAEDEGYGLFLDESLTLGLSCVARDIPVFRERAHYPNLFFCEGTPEAMAATILRAHATPQVPAAPAAIRSMGDFTRDLSDLVSSVLP